MIKDKTRLFKRGDLVRLVEWRGRFDLPSKYKPGQVYELAEREIDGHVTFVDEWATPVHVAYMVVEEPIEARTSSYSVVVNNEVNEVYVMLWQDCELYPHAIFPYGGTEHHRAYMSREQAMREANDMCNRLNTELEARRQEGGEAERDRLNSEYRKDNN